MTDQEKVAAWDKLKDAIERYKPGNTIALDFTNNIIVLNIVEVRQKVAVPIEPIDPNNPPDLGVSTSETIQHQDLIR